MKSFSWLFYRLSLELDYLGLTCQKCTNSIQAFQEVIKSLEEK